jgi:lysophospholipase L1-like esterase
MKRFLFWKLPLGVAIASAIVFATGFALILHGNVGDPVTAVDRREPELAPSAEGQPFGVILLGDSLALGTGDDSGLGIAGHLEAELARRNLQKRETVNLAVNGARTADLLQQLQSENIRRLVSQANVIIVSIGGNDLFGDLGYRPAPPRNPESVMGPVLERVGGIVAEVREVNPRGRIFLIGLYNPFRLAPEGARINTFVNRWNAELIEQFRSDAQLTVVQTSDIFSHRNRLSFDRFHPGREGYQMIGRRIAESM